MVRFFQYIIKIYSFLVSPLLGNNCRFHPTCSSYAHQTLEKHGILKGFYLIFLRILSCHPWSKREFYDPVPLLFAWRSILGYKRASNKDIKVKEASVSRLNKNLKVCGNDE